MSILLETLAVYKSQVSLEPATAASCCFAMTIVIIIIIIIIIVIIIVIIIIIIISVTIIIIRLIVWILLTHKLEGKGRRRQFQTLNN